MRVFRFVSLLIASCDFLGVDSATGDYGVAVDVSVKTGTQNSQRQLLEEVTPTAPPILVTLASPTATTTAAPPPLGPPTEISLFDEVRFRGTELKVTLHGTECANLTESWQNRAKSIHTHDGCVVVYHNLGCGTAGAAGGPSEKLWGGDNKSHSDLSDASFMTRSWSRFISSLGGCEGGSPK